VLVQISTPARDSTPPVAQAVRSRLLLDAITTLPGIASVSTSLGSIYTGGVATKYRVLGASDPTSESVVSTSYVGEHYFDTLGLPMLMGRGFAGLESGSPPAAVLSESLARQLFQDGNPIGRQLVFGSGRTSSTVEIIGVAGDVRRPRQEAIPRLYRPSVQGSPFASNSFFVRSRGEFGPQFEAEIRRAVFAVDPKLMVWSIQKVEDMVTGYSQTERSALIHLQALGTLALSLAAFGLFAMMNYNVVQRRSEFGVRYAIGATDSDIQGLVLFRAFKLVAGGLILGGCLAWALARSFGALLYQTPALDPLTNTVVALLLLATTLLACWLPLRRAAVIDVARLLRAE
jgi:putative ABC transport system permease protein